MKQLNEIKLQELRHHIDTWYKRGGYIYCLGMIMGMSVVEAITPKEALELDKYLTSLQKG